MNWTRSHIFITIPCCSIASDRKQSGLQVILLTANVLFSKSVRKLRVGGEGVGVAHRSRTTPNSFLQPPNGLYLRVEFRPAIWFFQPPHTSVCDSICTPSQVGVAHIMLGWSFGSDSTYQSLDDLRQLQSLNPSTSDFAIRALGSMTCCMKQ